jgi:acetokinase family protein
LTHTPSSVGARTCATCWLASRPTRARPPRWRPSATGSEYVGAYLAALGGAQAVVFTGAIGERSPEVRARACQGLEWLGPTLDPRAKTAATEGEPRISAAGARLAAFEIPTDEETEIARDAVKALHAASRTRTEE